MTEAFTLHPQLADDTLFIADLPLCRALLMKDARFPWLILVPRRAGIRELFDLSSSERAALMEETSAVAKMMHAHTDCDKINVAALGNQVPQLHVHVIARFASDAAWPRPVWCAASPSESYAAGKDEETVIKLQELIRYITSL